MTKDKEGDHGKFDDEVNILKSDHCGYLKRVKAQAEQFFTLALFEDIELKIESVNAKKDILARLKKAGKTAWE